MEKTPTKKTKSVLSRDQWKDAYMEHLLLSGEKPASVFAFAKNLKTTESEFYTHFNSFELLEQEIWNDWLKETIDVIEKDAAYAEYSVREKLLAFYFTWLETLKSHRSYVLKCFESLNRGELNPPFLGSTRDAFKAFVENLLKEGKESSEVAERPFSQQYEKGFWLQFLFVIRFWVKDGSKDFQNTDAAVEKSVHVAFDLVGKGALDTMLDFGKFLIQNRIRF